MILKRERPRLQRGVIVLPSAFTIGNLFFGIWAIVSAERGDFVWAAWFVVFSGIMDNLDGRIARFTRTGSDFGTELDSLVDAISFGVAPGFILYRAFFLEGWGWILSFAYIAAVVIRLARYNIQQGGHAKKHFIGLPSPTAGMLLATFYPFTTTRWFQENLSHLAEPQVVAGVTVAVAVLMLSHVPYPAVPRVSLRTGLGRFHLTWMALGVTLALTVPRHYFFPALALYTCMGLMRSFILGLLERLPDRDPLLDDDPDDDEEGRLLDYGEITQEPLRRPSTPLESDHP